MNAFTQSQRLLELPPYIFSEINQIKAEALKRGENLLSLAIGDPDEPTPNVIIQKLQEASLKGANHAYSPYEGTFQFRKAVADYFEKRFHTSLNPETEVLALIGSKEGIAHFPMAFCNPGDKCLFPSPGYPIFSTAIQLAGAVPVPIALRPENGFVPDPEELEKQIREIKPKYLLLNFPSNPTSATYSRDVLEKIVNLAIKYQVILVSDAAYAEVYFPGAEKPLSILEIPGAKEVAIEFHSLSKTFNMTGWRIAFAVGNPSLIAGLLRYKTNIDSGPLMAVQEAAQFALSQSEELCQPIRDLYARRRAIVLSGLQRLGVEYFEPKATFFVWAKVPGQERSMDFTKRLIQKSGLVVTPGIGFGDLGEHFFRLALTVPDSKLEDALARLGKAL